MESMKRSPTFLVGTVQQKDILGEFQKREQHYTEEYSKNKPLCFSARAYQQPHPAKVRMGYKDADATLTSPMLLGVCDGVSQLEEFQMDPSLLPNELLKTCEELAMLQLMPDTNVSPQDQYRGPISLLKEAYQETTSFGCRRRTNGRQSELEAVFHTEMQRIDYNVQTPLQLARVDERIDEEFDESIALEVIEKGSAVHCVSAYEGDVLILGSDGVFDNLFLDEIVEICNEILPAPTANHFSPMPAQYLMKAAQRIVKESHAKSDCVNGQFLDTPIGKGGKVDDTSVVVGEIIEWTEAHTQIWSEVRRNRRWKDVISCGGMQCGMATRHSCSCEGDEDEKSRFRGRSEDASEESSDEEEGNCSIA